MTILKGGLLAAELNTAHNQTILKGGLLTAELNTAQDLTILKGSLLAAELNTAHDLVRERPLFCALFIIRTTFRFGWVGGLRTDGCSN